MKLASQLLLMSAFFLSINAYADIASEYQKQKDDAVKKAEKDRAILERTEILDCHYVAYLAYSNTKPPFMLWLQPDIDGKSLKILDSMTARVEIIEDGKNSFMKWTTQDQFENEMHGNDVTRKFTWLRKSKLPNVEVQQFICEPLSNDMKHEFGIGLKSNESAPQSHASRQIAAQPDPKIESATNATPEIVNLPSASTLARDARANSSKTLAPVNAGFDCKKASTKVEIAICESRSLSLLDDLMGFAYKKEMQSSTGAEKERIKKEQIAWSKNEREKCGANEDCLVEAYTKRIDSLSPSYDAKNEFLTSRGWKEVPSYKDPTGRHCNREYENGGSKLFIQVYCAGDGFIQMVLDDKKISK